MGKRKDDVFFGGVRLDPDLAAEFNQGAATNRAALTEKQKRDRRRVYQRVDMPRWLKSSLFAAAEAQDVSASQWSAFLLAWAMTRYQASDPELLEAIDQNKTLYRSLNAGHALDLQALEELLEGGLTDSAEGLFEDVLGSSGVDADVDPAVDASVDIV